MILEQALKRHACGPSHTRSLAGAAWDLRAHYFPCWRSSSLMTCAKASHAAIKLMSTEHRARQRVWFGGPAAQKPTSSVGSVGNHWCNLRNDVRQSIRTRPRPCAFEGEPFSRIQSGYVLCVTHTNKTKQKQSGKSSGFRGGRHQKCRKQ